MRLDNTQEYGQSNNSTIFCIVKSDNTKCYTIVLQRSDKILTDIVPYIVEWLYALYYSTCKPTMGSEMWGNIGRHIAIKQCIVWVGLTIPT